MKKIKEMSKSTKKNETQKKKDRRANRVARLKTREEEALESGISVKELERLENGI